MTLRSLLSFPYGGIWIRSRYVHTLQSRGVGVFGALGLGNFDDKVHFTKVDVSGKNARSVAAGFGHSAIITTDGQLAICGRSFDLGSLFKSYGIYRVLPLFAVWAAKLTLSDTPRTNEIILEPTFIPELFKYNIVHTAASGGLTLALSDKGKLFAFGANLFGQCGLGVDRNRIWKPVPVSVPPVLWCDTGLQHAICVCEGGEVYCWGKGQNGQMGNNAAEEINAYPNRVPIPQPCVAVASGLNHCAAIGSDGTVYVWGRRMSLELESNREQTFRGGWVR
jgi:alpha-tubulin suppressor-like RCC1 family protein